MTAKRTLNAEKLDALAEKINEGHEQCLKLLRSSLTHARNTGTSLLRAKKLVKGSGQPWENWVQENCEFSISQAQRYMLIADRYHELLKKIENPEELSMTEALRMLSPGSGGKSGGSMPFSPLTVLSKVDLEELTEIAQYVEIPPDSKAEKFLDAQLTKLAARIIAFAKRAKLKDDEGHKVGDVQAALALIQKLTRDLPKLVVKVEKKPVKEEDDDEDEALDKRASRLHGRPSINGHREAAVA